MDTLPALRAALCEDDVDLVLPSRYGFMQRQSELEIVKDRTRRGPSASGTGSDCIWSCAWCRGSCCPPTRAWRCPRPRGPSRTPPSAWRSTRALRRVQQLFDDQFDIAHPRRSASPQALREQRSARDLVTLARALRWANPDIDYMEAKQLREPMKARWNALKQLLAAWEQREDLQPALDRFRAQGIAPPGEDLLTRMRVASQSVPFRPPPRGSMRGPWTGATP